LPFKTLAAETSKQEKATLEEEEQAYQQKKNHLLLDWFSLRVIE